jgi:hypothetical protein
VIGFAVTMIFLAVGAGFIGADADNKWGPFRKGILIFGLAGLVLLIGLKIIEAIDRRLMAQPRSAGVRSRFGMVVKRVSARIPDTFRHPEMSEFSMTRESSVVDSSVSADQKGRQKQAVQRAIFSSKGIPKKGLTLVLLFIAVELMYVLFVSVGHMTTWPNETSYYGMLADAFAQGQAELLIKPDPKLAELENPYPTAARPGIRTIPDASYFEGKYYVYWGPAPAAVVALWQIATSRPVGDEHIVFVAVSFIFVFSVLILLNLRRKYFPSLPGWMLVVGILLVATAHPLLWVLNWPTIYHAAIASAQAFLIAGLYFAIPVIDGTQSQPWRLILVGVLWVSAIGSRTSIAPALILLILATAIGLYFAQDGERKENGALKKIVILIFPIGIGIALIGFYNYVRFGNFLEVGFRYALSKNDLSWMFENGLIFNPLYLLPNLFYYLISPLQIEPIFPIIRPLWHEIPEVSMFLARFHIPDVHRVNDVTGILFAMPSILLVGFLAWELICYSRTRVADEPQAIGNIQTPSSLPGFRRVFWAILIAACVALAPIFFFFWVASRYLLDAIPLFAILAVVGSWLLYQSTRKYPLQGILAVLFILATVVIGALVSFVLAISGADSRFDDLNPALFETLSNLFSLKQ